MPSVVPLGRFTKHNIFPVDFMFRWSVFKMRFYITYLTNRRAISMDLSSYIFVIKKITPNTLLYLKVVYLLFRILFSNLVRCVVLQSALKTLMAKKGELTRVTYNICICSMGQDSWYHSVRFVNLCGDFAQFLRFNPSDCVCNEIATRALRKKRCTTAQKKNKTMTDDLTDHNYINAKYIQLYCLFFFCRKQTCSSFY